MLKKTKTGYAVTSKTGQVLGKHSTRKKAARQLAAIEASKARRARKR